MMTLYDNFITRSDGLNHLLLSDVNTLMERMAKDFPDVVKLNSIGRSVEDRDINVLEISMPNPNASNKPAFLMTGATHARELISTSFNIYQMLKLLMKGVVQKNDHYQELLMNNKFYFIPILNVDGVALIEKGWNENHKIIPQRKNMDMNNGCPGPAGEYGVDLNRNFAVDFGQIDDIVQYQNNDWLSEGDQSAKKNAKSKDPCVYNFAGPVAFSEPET